jgi:hypothetical protein
MNAERLQLISDGDAWRSSAIFWLAAKKGDDRAMVEVVLWWSHDFGY